MFLSGYFMLNDAHHPDFLTMSRDDGTSVAQHAYVMRGRS